MLPEGPHRDDRAGLYVDRAAPRVGLDDGQRAGAADRLAGAPLVPDPLGYLRIAGERRDEQAVPEQVRAGLVRVLLGIRVHKRERAHDGPSRARRLRRRGIEVGEEPVANVEVLAYRVRLLLFAEPYLVVVVPVVLLAPRREHAEVDGGDVERVHVAALVGVPRHAEVERRDQRTLAAARVARPCRDVALQARIARRGVDHRALAGVDLEPLGHLLVVDDGVHVVGLVVRELAGVHAPGELVHLLRGVELEAPRAAVDELLQVLEPGLLRRVLVLARELVGTPDALDSRVADLGLEQTGVHPLLLLSGEVALHALVEEHLRHEVAAAVAALRRRTRKPGGALLLEPEHVVVVAEPERQLEAHVLEGADPRAPVVGRLDPVGELEAPLVPALLGGEVVAVLHPAGLQADYVAGELLPAELERLARQVERVDVLVGDVGEAECERRQQRRAAGEARVRVEHRAVVSPLEHVEVDFALLRRHDHGVGVRLAHVKRVAEGRVDQHAPSRGSHHHRDRNVRVHVLHPYLVGVPAAVQALAAHVPEAVHAVALCEREPELETLPDLLGLGLDDAEVQG